MNKATLLAASYFAFQLAIPEYSFAESNASILSEIAVSAQNDRAQQNTPQKPTIKNDQTPFAPDFSFMDMQGNKQDINSYRGKWLIVNYWAIYCPPCRVEVTDLDMFARDNKNRAVILGMDAGGDSIEQLTKFKKEFKLSYSLIPAQESTMLGFGIIDAIPTTFIISPEGKLVDKHIGMISYDDLYAYITPVADAKKHTQVSRK